MNVNLWEVMKLIDALELDEVDKSLVRGNLIDKFVPKLRKKNLVDSGKTTVEVINVSHAHECAVVAVNGVARKVWAGDELFDNYIVTRVDNTFRYGYINIQGFAGGTSIKRSIQNGESREI